MRPPENEESTINTKRMRKIPQLVWILSESPVSAKPSKKLKRTVEKRPAM